MYYGQVVLGWMGGYVPGTATAVVARVEWGQVAGVAGVLISADKGGAAIDQDRYKPECTRLEAEQRVSSV